MGIVEEAADNLLNFLFAGIVEERTVIGWSGCLIVFTVGDWIGRVGTMLIFNGRGVSIASHLFEHILWHGKVDVAFVVIPLEIDTTVEVAGTVFHNLVGFRSKSIVEVLEMGFANVLNAKVINGKIKPHRMGFVLPETGSMGLHGVSVTG